MFIQIQDSIYNVNHIKQVIINRCEPKFIEVFATSSESSTTHRYKTATEAKEAFEEIVKKLPQI